MTKDPIKLERIVYQILSAIWRQRRVIIMPAIIFPFIGLLMWGVTAKKYEIATTILIQEPSKINPFLEDLSIATNLKQRMNSLNALLHSRHVLQAVLHDFKEIDKDTDGETIRQKLVELSSSVSAELIGSELVQLKLRSTDMVEMDKKLEMISQRFVERVFDPAWSSLKSSEKFLNNELEQSKETLGIAEKELAQFKSEHSEELPELHTHNVQRFTNTQENLAQKRSQYSGAKAALESMQSRLVQTNPIIGKLEEELIKNMGELAMLQARYTANHSKVKAAIRNIKHIQNERSRILSQDTQPQVADIEQLWNVASSMFTKGDGKQPLLISQMENMEEIKAKISSLGNEIKVLEEIEIKLKQKVNNFGNIEQQLIALEDSTKIKREVYGGMLKRAEMARITGNLGRFEVPNRVKIIDKPAMPPAVLTPSLIMFILAGLIGGLAIGIGIAVMIETTDNTVRYSQQLIALTGQPVLFTIAPVYDEIEMVA